MDDRNALSLSMLPDDAQTSILSFLSPRNLARFFKASTIYHRAASALYVAVSAPKALRPHHVPGHVWAYTCNPVCFPCVGPLLHLELPQVSSEHDAEGAFPRSAFM
jgi:hypothetical protein